MFANALKAYVVAKGGAGAINVFDAGCGTGHVAHVLAGANGRAQGQPEDVTLWFADKVTLCFDGVDFSQGMLEVARRKGDYRTLVQADLTKTLAFESNTYDAVTSSGVFLQGHVGAECVSELARILVPGGFMVFTVRPTFYEETKSDWAAAMEDARRWTLYEPTGYRTSRCRRESLRFWDTSLRVKRA